MSRNAHAINHHFFVPIFPPACLPMLLSIVSFFFITVSCDRKKKSGLPKGQEKKGKGITTPTRSGRSFHALVVWYWKKKEKTIEHMKDDQPSLLKYRPDEGY